MEDIKMRYKGVCKSCDYRFAESDEPIIKDMPMTCPLCKCDMAVLPIHEEILKDYSYEVVIQCKGNGANVINGFMMTAEDLAEKDEVKYGILAKRICEIVSKVVTNTSNMHNLTRK